MLYGSSLTANGYPNPLNDSRAPDIIIQAVAGASDALQENLTKSRMRSCRCGS